MRGAIVRVSSVGLRFTIRTLIEGGRVSEAKHFSGFSLCRQPRAEDRYSPWLPWQCLQ